MERSVFLWLTTLAYVVAFLAHSGSANHHNYGTEENHSGHHARHDRHNNNNHNGGHGITCYDCNSEYDPTCADPFDPYSLGTVNCSLRPALEHLSHLPATLCRKTVQKVYGKVRVVRGCGYVTDERDNKECMKRSGTHDVQALYCSCTGSLCNAAPASLAAAAAPLALLAALLHPSV